MSDKQANLIGGRRLARNVLWNLLGTGAPLLVALVAIPMLIEGLGTARFGVLTLAWMVVGYFSLFDLGLGRALTKLVAEKLGKGQNDELPSLIWTAMSLMAVLGVLGAAVVAALSPWLVGGVLKIPAELQSETLTAFYLLAASIPIVISSTGLRGILEAHQRFSLVNAVRIPLGIFTFLGPLAVLPFSNSLSHVVATLVVARLIAYGLYISFCLRVEPELKVSIGVRRVLVRPLLSFGGWMTVSNIVGPIIMYSDRLLIGVSLSMTAVAYYATPFEIITKLWIIPVAFVGVIFPAFSYSLARNDEDACRLFISAMKLVFIVMLPMSFLSILYAHDMLYFWLDKDFSDHSGLILQVMAIGVFVNSVAQVPSALIQALGRPDLKAKIHLVELPIFIALLFTLLDKYGVLGGAIAFTVRMIVDFAVFMIVAGALHQKSIASVKWAVSAVLYGTVFMLLPLFVNLELPYKHYISVIFLLLFVWFARSRLLDDREKTIFVSWIRSKVPV
jgi:O-antigen/teichoic acid export membrane protein